MQFVDYPFPRWSASKARNETELYIMIRKNGVIRSKTKSVCKNGLTIGMQFVRQFS